jgi:TP901 family phage tail tape measure protein
MADYNIGTAHGRIEVDSSSLGRTAASLGFMANRMLLVGGAAVAGVGCAVKAAADFETQLSRFSAVSNATEKDMELVRKKALQLGQDSAFGAKQVAEGFVEIGKAGLSAKEILAGVGDAAVFLAAAGELDMAAATTILVETMQQFQLEGKDAIGIANLLAGAANASTAEVGDLAYSLKYAGPVAAEFGISLEDTAAMLGIFANNGIKGSTAGTSFRSILLGLAAQTPKATKVLKDLGIVTADGANKFYGLDGKLRPLPEIMQTLQDSMKGLSDKERIAATNTLFLRRALAAALVGAREGATGFEKMKAKMGDVTAEEVMNEKLDNLQGSLRKAKASFETLAIVIGAEFQEPLKQTADRVRDLANWFVNLNPKFRKFVGYGVLAFGAMLIFGGVMLKTIEYTIRFRKALLELNIAMKAMTPGLHALMIKMLAALGPISLIVIAILAIAAVAYFFYKNWDKVWTLIKDHPALAIIIGALLAFIAPFILIGFAIAALAKNWRAIWDKIKQWTLAAKDAILGAWDSLVAWFRTKFIPFFTVTLVNFFKGLPAKMASWGRAAVQAFMNFFDDFPAKVSFALGFVLGKMTVWASQLLFLIIDTGVLIATKFIEWAPGIVLAIVELGIQVLAAMALWLLDMAAKMPGWLFETTTKMAEWTTDMLFKMLDLGVRIVRAAGEWAVGVGPEIFKFLASLPGDLLNFGIRMLTEFLAGFNIGVGGIWNFMADLATGFISRLLSIPGDFFTAGVEAMKDLLKGLQSMAGRVKDFVGDFAGGVARTLTGGLLGSPYYFTRHVGKDMMKDLIVGIQKGSPDVMRMLNRLDSQVTGFSPMIGAAAGGGGTNSAGLTIDKVVVEVHGVSDPAQAQAVGEAAGSGFMGALERRQVRTIARML